MKLIVGLGNPGKDYKNTRHNVGFMFLDEFAKQNSLKFKVDLAFKCEITNTRINDEIVYLIKPLTYMNNSGISVYNVSNYYKIDSKDILVIHDDLDLELGRIRFRNHGTSGGHKGVQSIINETGTSDFSRLKVGISKVDKEDTIDYVIGYFSKSERAEIDKFTCDVSNMITDFCTLDFDTLMSKYNN